MQDLLLALDRLLKKSATDGQNRPSVARVAYRALLARIDPGMDLLARLSFLEGVATSQGESIKPGQWMMKGRRGFKEAQKVFPNLHPEWGATQNSGFFQAAIQGLKAKGLIPDDATATRLYGSTIDAIVSDFMQGVNPVTGGRVKPVFYEVGLTLLSPSEIEGLAEGALRPTASGIRGAIAKKFYARGLDIFRAHKRKVQQRKRVPPTVSWGTSPELEGDGALVSNALFAELRKRSSPIADRIRETLKQMVHKGMKGEAAESFAVFLDTIKGHAQLPTSGGKVLPGGWAKEVAKATGKNENAVRNNVNRALKWLEKNGRKSSLFPRLKKLVDRIESVGALGMGARTAGELTADEVFSEWIATELEMLGEVTRQHDIGPFSLTTVKYPDAPRGGYRFSVEAVADRFEKRADQVLDQLKKPLERDAKLFLDLDGEPTHFVLRKGAVPMKTVEAFLKRNLGSYTMKPARSRGRGKAMFTVAFASRLPHDKGERVEAPLEIELKLKK